MVQIEEVLVMTFSPISPQAREGVERTRPLGASHWHQLRFLVLSHSKKQNKTRTSRAPDDSVTTNDLLF